MNGSFTFALFLMQPNHRKGFGFRNADHVQLRFVFLHFCSNCRARVARPSDKLQTAMTSRKKENKGWWKEEERGYFQKSKWTDNDQQESGSAEPINKRRIFFFLSFSSLFFAFRAENLYV